MNRTNQIEILKKSSFTEYEAKCYLALFEKESLTISEVAILAGIPRPSAYETLRGIHAKGLCVSLPGKTKKYAAADPKCLHDKLFESFNNSMKAADELVNKLNISFQKSRSNGSPLDYIEVLKEPYQSMRKYMDLIDQSTREIFVFSKPPYSFSTKKQRSEQEECVIRAIKRGVRIRSIYETPRDPEGIADVIEKIRAWTAKDEEMKIIDSLPIKLAVFDEITVMLPLEDKMQERSSLTTLIAEHHDLAKSLKFLFESFWEKAKSLEESGMWEKKGKRKGGGPA